MKEKETMYSVTSVMSLPYAKVSVDIEPTAIENVYPGTQCHPGKFILSKGEAEVAWKHDYYLMEMGNIGLDLEQIQNSVYYYTDLQSSYFPTALFSRPVLISYPCLSEMY